WSERYLPYLQEVGLLPFERLAAFTPDPHLITALMERWRPETNTFNMYHKECSITLQDVAHLTGLPVTGDALYVEYEKDTNWAAKVEEVLGKFPGGHLKGDGRVKMHGHFFRQDSRQLFSFQQASRHLFQLSAGFPTPLQLSARFASLLAVERCFVHDSRQPFQIQYKCSFCFTIQDLSSNFQINNIIQTKAL
ncbi:Serine/threonine-protein phosphatase 7 long form homolog, partial [Linum grandiflorum]